MNLCDNCETAGWCYKNGCIPVTREPLTPKETSEALGEALVHLRAINEVLARLREPQEGL